MPTIYDLKKEQQELLDRLFFDEDNESIQFELNKINGDIKSNLECRLTVLHELQAIEEQAKRVWQELGERKKRASNAVDKLKQHILDNMREAGIDRLDGTYGSVAYKANIPSVVITNEELLDKHFVIEKIVREPDKSLIKSMIKNGVDVEGAELVYVPYLRKC